VTSIVPVWIKVVPVNPPMPIHVAANWSEADGTTEGTFQDALTEVTFEPSSTSPDQFAATRNVPVAPLRTCTGGREARGSGASASGRR
jgi:hypothetical protein